MNTYELDATNLLCPMPVIRTQQKVKDLEPGDQLTVLCTDPGAEPDIRAWCRVNGHIFLDDKVEKKEEEHQPTVISVTVQVGEGEA